MKRPGLLKPLPPRGSMDWQDRSTCQWQDPSLFDELAGKPSSDDRKRIAKAKEICASCPVMTECLAFGIANKESGVRGGEYLSLGRRLDIREPDYRPKKAA